MTAAAPIKAGCPVWLLLIKGLPERYHGLVFRHHFTLSKWGHWYRFVDLRKPGSVKAAAMIEAELKPYSIECEWRPMRSRRGKAHPHPLFEERAVTARPRQRHHRS